MRHEMWTLEKMKVSFYQDIYVFFLGILRKQFSFIRGTSNIL